MRLTPAHHFDAPRLLGLQSISRSIITIPKDRKVTSEVPTARGHRSTKIIHSCAQVRFCEEQHLVTEKNPQNYEQTPRFEQEIFLIRTLFFLDNEQQELL